jgi:NitT/TauT family transport system permease protein
MTELATDQPVAGQPVTGQPVTGQPVTGQPTAGQAAGRDDDRAAGPGGAAGPPNTAAGRPGTAAGSLPLPRPPRLSLTMRVLKSARVWFVLVVGLAVWELVTRLGDVPTYLFPAPGKVVDQLVNRPELYLEAVWTTTVETVVGFALAVGAGVLLGVLIARSRLTEEILYPYLNIIRVTPTIALAPLLTIWMGRGMTPIIVVTALTAFFPIVVQTVLGLKSTDPALVDLMRIANAGEITVLRKIRFPNSLPYLFSAFRISAPTAVIGALVGEFISGEKGLGYLLITAQGQLNTSAVFLVIVLSALLGIVLFNLLVLLERRVVRWHPAVPL